MDLDQGQEAQKAVMYAWVAGLLNLQIWVRMPDAIYKPTSRSAPVMSNANRQFTCGHLSPGTSANALSLPC